MRDVACSMCVHVANVHVTCVCTGTRTHESMMAEEGKAPVVVYVDGEWR